MTWLDTLRLWWFRPLLSFGKTEVTPWSLTVLVLSTAAVIWGSGVVRRLIVRALRRNNRVDVGVADAIGTMARYVVAIGGLLVVVQSTGIDLTTLNVVAGAVGVGVGFGLQGIAANFISGLVLLIGRPIKVGDRVEVSGVDGDVIQIGARATTVLTNDGIAIVVPNSKFVSEVVVNWSHTDRRVRFRIPISVAYGTDIDQVRTILLEVARQNPDVLDTPAPEVWLVEFGDSGLGVELLVWTTTMVHAKRRLTAALNDAMYKAFAHHEIEIPFPQRVVHWSTPPGANSH